MNDDELRQRLHAMPPPTTTIDVDAVVADARRRRRPKVIGVGVAVGAACLAFLAPVVVPGLLGPDPVTAMLQEQDAAGPAPAGSAPDASTAGEAPGSGAPSADDGGADADDQGASGSVDACAAVPAAQVAEGLSLTFLAQPADGEATLLVANSSDDALVVRIGDVGLASVDGDGVLATAPVDPGSGSTGVEVRLGPGDVERVAVDVATDLTPCTADGAIDGTLVPLVVVAVGTGAEAGEPALGDPTAS